MTQLRLSTPQILLLFVVMTIGLLGINASIIVATKTGITIPINATTDLDEAPDAEENSTYFIISCGLFDRNQKSFLKVKKVPMYQRFLIF